MSAKKLLIGGQALATLGSSRSTSDTDYLVNDNTNTSAFIHDQANNIDYCNANGNRFFAEIWNMELANNSDVASLQALLELKAFSFVQHCINRKFQKADDAEFDIKFIIRLMGKRIAPSITKKYVTIGQYNEVINVINSVKF